jgi:hypothetical protein
MARPMTTAPMTSSPWVMRSACTCQASPPAACTSPAEPVTSAVLIRPLSSGGTPVVGSWPSGLPSPSTITSHDAARLARNSSRSSCTVAGSPVETMAPSRGCDAVTRAAAAHCAAAPYSSGTTPRPERSVASATCSFTPRSTVTCSAHQVAPRAPMTTAVTPNRIALRSLIACPPAWSRRPRCLPRPPRP